MLNDLLESRSRLEVIWIGAGNGCHLTISPLQHGVKSDCVKRGKYTSALHFPPEDAEGAQCYIKHEVAMAFFSVF
ncbi:hypothetical protein [Escherichia coli]|uniref:hypothetical protein n=1 Tax=Escherichia coli TaxID=562 RepID=UPI00100898D3|nr:hypothetical protein [Escherichia coli]